MILLAIYTSVGAVLAARMWAPDTFSEPLERIVLVDRRAMDDVETHQQSLIERDDAAPVQQTS